MVRDYLEGIDSGNLAIIDDLFTSDAVIHFPGVPDLDRAGWKQVLTSFYTAFPDLHHEVQDQLATEDRVAFRWIAPGTHQKEFQGVQPRGKRVTFSGISLVRVAAGRIAEYWLSMDRLDPLYQMGAIPSPV
jgi:predicted ester cyclase